MNTFDSIIYWLDGKKALIGSVLNAINAYLISAGVIDANLGGLIATIILILTGAGVIVTNNAVKNNTDLGIAIKQQRIR